MKNKMIKEGYNWQEWIDSFDTDEIGRIIVTEEEESEHMIKMIEVNKGWKSKFTKEYLDALPKDKDGYVTITLEQKATHTKMMNWVSENYPNCRFLPLALQDIIGDECNKIFLK